NRARLQRSIMYLQLADSNSVMCMIDVLTIHDFLDDATRDDLRAQLRLAGNSPAKVYGTNTGGAVDSRMRKAARILVPPETCERVKRLVIERKGAIEEHLK